VVAIVVPERPQLEKWAKENNVEFSSYDELCRNEKVNAFLLAEIKTYGKAGGLFGFEIPTKIHISAELFSAENDLLTPTFKLKRNEAKLHFLKQIKEMYDGAKLQGEK
jgi:long-chain acyl-CoA synthetase